MWRKPTCINSDDEIPSVSKKVYLVDADVFAQWKGSQEI